MVFRRIRALAAALVPLVLASAGAPLAHGTDGHAEAPAGATAAGAGTAAELTQSIDLQAAEVPVLQVARGAHVRLTLLDTGAGEMHLHGYGIEIEGKQGKPAVFVFDAAYSGRFPVEMHVSDDLLGGREKAILYIEVREP